MKLTEEEMKRIRKECLEEFSEHALCVIDCRLCSPFYFYEFCLKNDISGNPKNWTDEDIERVGIEDHD